MDNKPTVTLNLDEIGSMMTMLASAHRAGILHPEDFVDAFDRAVFYKAIDALKHKSINLQVHGKFI
jgi:hypothetical protein